MEPDGGGKRSRKKESNYSRTRPMTPDQINKTVNAAMKQMDEALKNVNLSTGGGGQGVKRKPAGPKIQPTLYSFNNATNNYIGTVVHINNSSNVQVGSNNRMVVDKTGRKRFEDTDSSSDDDSDFNDYDDGVFDPAAHRHVYPGQHAPPTTTSQPNEMQQKDNDWMSDEEKKILELTRSQRQLNHEDVAIVCDTVGNWRRFFRILGLEDALLEQLNQDFYAQGVKVILMEGLKEWMAKEGSHACVGRLTSTLQKIGYTDSLKKFRL